MWRQTKGDLALLTSSSDPGSLAGRAVVLIENYVSHDNRFGADASCQQDGSMAAMDEATRKRVRAGRLMLAGKSPAEAAKAVGVARQTAYTCLAFRTRTPPSRMGCYWLGESNKVSTSRAECSTRTTSMPPVIGR